MTDRTLALSIPADDDNNDVKTPLQLQDILVDYFYNNIITGVRRQVYNDDQSSISSVSSYNSSRNQDNTISENVAASPSMATYLNDQNIDSSNTLDEKDTLKKLLKQAKSKQQETKHIEEQEDEEIAVTAWQVLELLPFYSAMNEQGDAIKTQVDSSFPDTHMILPIVLKRYRYNSEGGSTKTKKRVEIPVTIDFNKFVNQNADDPMCPTCGHLIDWTLHFKSAVCHKGDSPYSGHYISYARVTNENDDDADDNDSDEKPPYWLKLDDMNRDSRVTVIKDNNNDSIYADLAENAYIVFYELDKTCHHERNSLYSDSADEIERKEDIKSTGSNSTHKTDTEEQTCNCNNEKSTTKSSKSKSKHKHHHHHYHRYHLKESCNLM
jgi:hypothetical protein